MPLYSITNKDNVIECKWNCSKKHEHYLGKYEDAIKYFGIDIENIESYGKLINIIIYHQTNERTAKKLSNELFDIMVRAQSEHKYWAPSKDRENNALDALDQAEKMGLIYDDDLLHILQSSKRRQSNYRAYQYKEWVKKYG